MKGLQYLLLPLSTALIVVSTIDSAIAQSQIWSGSGLIVQGTNRGASVRLKIRVDDNVVYFLQGQSQGEQVILPEEPNQSVPTNSGEWTFDFRDEDRMIAIFTETHPTITELPADSKSGRLRTIEYILKPEPS